MSGSSVPMEKSRACHIRDELGVLNDEEMNGRFGRQVMDAALGD
jgi:hypothetical protein